MTLVFNFIYSWISTILEMFFSIELVRNYALVLLSLILLGIIYNILRKKGG